MTSSPLVVQVPDHAPGIVLVGRILRALVAAGRPVVERHGFLLAALDADRAGIAAVASSYGVLVVRDDALAAAA